MKSVATSFYRGLREEADAALRVGDREEEKKGGGARPPGRAQPSRIFAVPGASRHASP